MYRRSSLLRLGEAVAAHAPVHSCTQPGKFDTQYSVSLFDIAKVAPGKGVLPTTYKLRNQKSFANGSEKTEALAQHSSENHRLGQNSIPSSHQNIGKLNTDGRNKTATRVVSGSPVVFLVSSRYPKRFGGDFWWLKDKAIILQ